MKHVTKQEVFVKGERQGGRRAQVRITARWATDIIRLAYVLRVTFVYFVVIF